ncbi:Peptidase S16, lon domain-containing protein [Bifidobacterium magnum]|uniref:endopeptidase La n=2 Tax=Bifidobacterium magnum TaxID=1692 RepID=A0A087BDR7_9BIFI|nr:Peptidase S16, lon domain-containing protein [Bifidobacterium magnum]
MFPFTLQIHNNVNFVNTMEGMSTLHTTDVPPSQAGQSPDESRHARGGVRAFFHGKPRKYFVGLCAVLLGVVILCLPSAYVMEMPGPTANVLGKDEGKEIISVQGVPVHKDTGKLLLVTVNASGVPGYPVTNAQIAYAWLSGHMTVMPREAIFPVGQSAEEYEHESDKEMTTSQDDAVAAVRNFAKSHHIDTDGMKVTMHVDDIGGPSAGMMYALGLIDKLTPVKEVNGTVIAGTGSINADGKVGSIGGIDLKMLGAKRDGATWFLAPESNCDEVEGHVPGGLRVVKVATLDEAYDALVTIGNGTAQSLPSCSAKQ